MDLYIKQNQFLRGKEGGFNAQTSPKTLIELIGGFETSYCIFTD